MPSFTEELLLLLPVDRSGAAAGIPATALSCAFAGAVLMDLAFANRIDTDSATLFVVDRTPTGNPGPDRVLARIGAWEEAMDTRAWIAALSEREARVARELAMVSLVRRGMVSPPADSFNWAYRARGGAAVDRAVERDVRLRVGDALFSDDIPAARDAALIGLVDACGLLGGLFPDRDLEACGPRIALLRGMETINREIAGAISDIEHGARALAAADRSAGGLPGRSSLR